VCAFAALLALFQLIQARRAFKKGLAGEKTQRGQKRIERFRMIHMLSSFGWLLAATMTAQNPRKYLAGHDLVCSLLQAASFALFWWGNVFILAHMVCLLEKNQRATIMRALSSGSIPLTDGPIGNFTQEKRNDARRLQRLGDKISLVMTVSSLTIPGCALWPHLSSALLTTHLCVNALGIIGAVMIANTATRNLVREIRMFASLDSSIRNNSSTVALDSASFQILIKRILFLKNETLRQGALNVMVGFMFCAVPYLRQLGIYFWIICFTLAQIFSLAVNIIYRPRLGILKTKGKRVFVTYKQSTELE